MYKLTFNDKTYPLTTSNFCGVALLVVTFLCWAGWMIYLSTSMLCYYTGIYKVLWAVIILALLATLTINGVDKRLLPEWAQKTIGVFLFAGTILHQIYVADMSIPLVCLLVAPLIIAQVVRTVRWLKKDQ